MEMRPTNAAAINKPRHIAGIDPRTLPVAFFATSACMLFGYSILGIVIFIAICAVGVRIAKHDPQLLPILIKVARQKKLYDPAKRSYFRLDIIRKDENA